MHSPPLWRGRLQLLVLPAPPAPRVAGDSPGERDAWSHLRCCELGMASTWQKTQEFYNWILESGDPRTDPWPLVYSPLPVTLIFTSYLFMVALGPSCMRQRQQLELRALLLTYNLAMVALSSYMFYEFLVTSVLANYSYLCQPVDYSQSELGMRMARVCWWFFFSKVIELLDTVFLILRKKQEQVTFLHVYHHGSMLFNWWSGVKYVPGGQAFFVGMLNSFVHIFMYGYYALASLGPRMRQHLWWKRYLTILQLSARSLMASTPQSSSTSSASWLSSYDSTIRPTSGESGKS
ncbi:very long chain fatty acid elongase 4-like isoform X3 [Melospiza melodia melodia]|uniref:very long chain fatty acid elongase 4-like isoform X3 n=1 Tax=Melospiza melodia melodia TaxID=1914991 RepID=UPI002FCE9DAB